MVLVELAKLHHLTHMQRHSEAVAPLRTSGTRRCGHAANSIYRSCSFQYPRDDYTHSVLLLGTSKFSSQPLTQDKLNTLRIKLSNLQLLIIDEICMVGSNMLFQIHK